MSDDNNGMNPPPTSRRRNRRKPPAQQAADFPTASLASGAAATPRKTRRRRDAGSPAPAEPAATMPVAAKSSGSKPATATKTQRRPPPPTPLATESVKPSESRAKTRKETASARTRRGRSTAGGTPGGVATRDQDAAAPPSQPFEPWLTEAPRAEPAPRRNVAGSARKRGNGVTPPAAEPDGPVELREGTELVAGMEFLDENPFEAELLELQRRRIELREAASKRVRPNPLLDLSLLDDPEEALIKGVAVIRQSLRELLTGETARLVDTSAPTELDALRKQLETRKLVLEAALKDLSGQLTRLRNRLREAEAKTATEPRTHAANEHSDTRR